MNMHTQSERREMAVKYVEEMDYIQNENRRCAGLGFEAGFDAGFKACAEMAAEIIQCTALTKGMCNGPTKCMACWQADEIRAQGGITNHKS